MDIVIQVQILDKTVSISHNTLWKYMHTTMGKTVGQIGLFSLGIATTVEEKLYSNVLNST